MVTTTIDSQQCFWETLPRLVGIKCKLTNCKVTVVQKDPPPLCTSLDPIIRTLGGVSTTRHTWHSHLKTMPPDISKSWRNGSKDKASDRPEREILKAIYKAKEGAVFSVKQADSFYRQLDP